MADLIKAPNGQAKDSVNASSLNTINMFHAENGLSNIDMFHADSELSSLDSIKDNEIILRPLYSNNITIDNSLKIPIAPSDLMFNEDSDFKSINLINYGELNVSMNRKLATWSITSFFPIVTGLYWFDNYGEKSTINPYTLYCSKLLNWKNSQTPLVFEFKTWGEYYNCLIKKFEYGRKDAVGNVYYQLDFQEYKEYTKYDTGAKGTDYSSDTYYPGVGETILQVIKKLYGSSSESNLEYFMNLNGLTIPTIDAGVGYKVR